jgi:hypothetical protein
MNLDNNFLTPNLNHSGGARLSCPSKINKASIMWATKKQLTKETILFYANLQLRSSWPTNTNPFLWNFLDIIAPIEMIHRKHIVFPTTHFQHPNQHLTRMCKLQICSTQIKENIMRSCKVASRNLLFPFNLTSWKFCSCLDCNPSLEVDYCQS